MRIPGCPRSFLALLGPLGLVAGGCTLFDGIVCTDEFVYGLTVTVRDSLTDIPAGRQAIVSARDRGWSETLRPVDDSLTFVGAGERRGTYQIIVAKSGYQTWSRDGVRVVANACHVQPVTVPVRLQRLP